MRGWPTPFAAAINTQITQFDDQGGATDPAVVEQLCLIGRQVAAVVNFPPRQIGKFMSEVLTLGFPDRDGAVVLFSPDITVPNGGRLF